MCKERMSEPASTPASVEVETENATRPAAAATPEPSEIAKVADTSSSAAVAGRSTSTPSADQSTVAASGTLERLPETSRSEMYSSSAASKPTSVTVSACNWKAL